MLGGLGLSVGALLIDVMLPGPAAASASVAPEQAAPAASAAAPQAAAGRTATTASPSTVVMSDAAKHTALMQVVNRLRSVEEVDAPSINASHDPFSFGVPETVEAPVEIKIDPERYIIDEPKPVVELPPEKPRMQITSIMNAAEGRIALVNGKICREGDAIQGWTIVRIADRSVDIAHGSYTATVMMDPR